MNFREKSNGFTGKEAEMSRYLSVCLWGEVLYGLGIVDTRRIGITWHLSLTTTIDRFSTKMENLERANAQLKERIVKHEDNDGSAPRQIKMNPSNSK